MIKLKNGWGIKADNYGYCSGKVVQRKVVDKDTKEEILVEDIAGNTVCYHDSLVHHFERIIKYEQREMVAENDMDLAEAIKVMKAINEDWKKYFKEMKQELESVR